MDVVTMPSGAKVVVVTEAELKAAGACPVYDKSPEWDEKRRALVYKDFDKTVERLSSNASTHTFLRFLVDKKLVPLDKVEPYRGIDLRLRYADAS